MGATPSLRPPGNAVGPHEAPTEFAALPQGPPPGQQQQQQQQQQPNVIFSAPEGPPPGRGAGNQQQDPFGDHNEVPSSLGGGAGLRAPLQPQQQNYYKPQRHSYGLPPSSMSVAQANGGTLESNPGGVGGNVGNNDGANEQQQPPAVKPRYRF